MSVRVGPETELFTSRPTPYFQGLSDNTYLPCLVTRQQQKNSCMGCNDMHESKMAPKVLYTLSTTLSLPALCPLSNLLPPLPLPVTDDFMSLRPSFYCGQN
jgi:hypothetical protein